eukprot:335400-Prymnesium_polylepis.1
MARFVGLAMVQSSRLPYEDDGHPIECTVRPLSTQLPDTWRGLGGGGGAGGGAGGVGGGEGGGEDGGGGEGGEGGRGGA